MDNNNPQQPPVSPFPDFAKVNQFITNNQDNVLSGSNSKTFFDRGVNHDEFDDKGVPYVYGIDNNRRLAESQSFGEKLNRTLNPVKLVSSIALGIMENIGYLGDLAFDWDEKDYTNALVEAAVKGREELNNPDNSFIGSLIGKGEAYRKDPSKVWELNDQSWWLNNADSLLESIGEFAVTGWGVGKALGAGAKALANAAKFNKVLTIGSDAAAQLGTAGVLAYTEGAMSGARVYKDVFSNALAPVSEGGLGYTEEEAKNLASEAASKTVYTNTLINTALNLTSVSKLFPTNRGINELEKLGLKRTLGETVEQYANRLKQASSNPQINSSMRRGLGKYGIEALQEGIEEDVNLYAEGEGRTLGKLQDENNFLDTMFSSEGGLNFVLGAIGGIGQTAVMDNLPIGKKYKLDSQGQKIPVLSPQGEPTGQFETERKTLNEIQKEDEFAKYADYVNTLSGDLEDSFTKGKELNVLSTKRKNNEISQEEFESQTGKIKEELFNVSLLKSLYNGTGEELAARFENISNIDNEKDLGEKVKKDKQQRVDELKGRLSDPQLEDTERQAINDELKTIEAAINENIGYTEAMKMGLAVNKSDNYYKEEAKKTVDKIKRRTEAYYDIQSRFNYGDEETYNLGHHIFNIYNHKEDLASYSEHLQDTINALKEVNLDNLGDLTLNDIADNVIRKESLKKTLDSKNATFTKLKDELERTKELTPETKRKYKSRTNDEVLDNLQSQISYLSNKINGIDGTIDQSLDSYKLLDENKDLSDEQLKRKYTQYALESNSYFNYNKETIGKLEEMKAENDAEHKAVDDSYKQITSTRGRKDFVATAKKNFEELAKKHQDKKARYTQESRNQSQVRQGSTAMNMDTIDEKDVPLTTFDDDIDDKAKDLEGSSVEDFFNAAPPAVNVVDDLETRRTRELNSIKPAKASGLTKLLGDKDGFEYKQIHKASKGIEELTTFKQVLTREEAEREINSRYDEEKAGSVETKQEEQDLSSLTPKEIAKEFANTVEGVDITLHAPAFDLDLLNKRIKLVSAMLEKLDKSKDEVKDVNNFAEVSYWMHKAIGKDNFQLVYNIFKGVYTIVKDQEIKDKKVTYLNKEYDEMFASFDEENDDTFFGVDENDLDEARKEEQLVFIPDGFKLVNGATSLASKTREFTEKDGVFNFISNDLYQYTNSLLLTNEVKVGDDLIFRVVNQDTQDLDDITKKKYEDNKNNKLKIPIQIVHVKSEQVIGYVHDIDYINANRVAEKDNNIKVQYDKLVDLRDSIVTKGLINSRITDKKDGTLARNSEKLDGFPKYRTGTEALKGNLEFVVYAGTGEFKSSATKQFNEELINKVTETQNKKFYKKGAVYVVLPTPTGKKYAHLLQTAKLKGEDVETVIQAIKASFAKDTKVKEDIEKTTGDNIFTVDGLEQFVRRFVHNRSYKHKELKSSEKRFLNVTAKGVAFSKAGGVFNFIDRGPTIKQEDVEKLRKHLSQMFFNVNADSLSDSSYKKVKIVDGVITSEDVKYSDIVKDNIVTDLTSLNMGNDKFAYFDNPVVEFSFKNEESTTEESTTEPVIKAAEKKSVGNAINDRIKERTKSLELKLPGFKPVNKKFVTTRKRIREQMIDNNIINKYNEIIDYQRYLIYKNRVNEQAKKSFTFIKDELIFEEDIQRETNRVIFQEEYLKKIDEARGVRKAYIMQLPSFRSIDEADVNIESLNKSYEDYLVDLSMFTALEQEDIVRYIAALANEEIKKAKGTRINLSEAFKRVRQGEEFKDKIDEDNKFYYDKFFEFAKVRLKQIYKIRIEENTDLSDYNEADDKEAFQSFESDRALKEDSKSKIGKQVKTFLHFIKEGKVNSMGMEGFADFDIIYNNLKALLSGLPPNIELMLNVMRDNASSHTYMEGLIDKLENADFQVKSQFAVNMASHHARFKMVIWTNKLSGEGKDDNGNFLYTTEARVIDVNRNSITQTIMSQWAENLKDSSLVTIKNGQLALDLKAIKAIGEELKEIEPSNLEGLKATLEKLGIDISVNALKSLREKSDVGVFKKIKSWDGQFEQGKGIFGRIISSIEAINKEELNEDDSLESNNPLYNNTGIKQLAQEESIFNDRLYSNSFQDGEGNTIYSYSQNKYITDRVAELTSPNSKLVDDLITKVKFSSSSTYLEWLKDDPAFASALNIFYFDTLTKRGRNGIKAPSMSTREQELTKLSLFMNEGSTAQTGSVTKRLINVITPTNSDKSLPMGLSTFGIDVGFSNGRIDNKTLDYIYRVYLGESNRIRNWQDLKDKDRLSEVNNEEFEQGGGKFFLFPDFNNKDKHSALWKEDVLNVDSINSTDIKDYVKNQINDYIIDLAKNKVKEWQKMSLVSIKPDKEVLSFFDTKYIDRIVKKKIDVDNQESLVGASMYIAVDYLANGIFANGNIFQTIIGDPALFYKKGDEKGSDLENTFINIGKRLSNQIAPGSSQADSDEGSFIQVYGKDLKGSVVNIEEIRSLFSGVNPDNVAKVNKYENTNRTDAQGLVTWETAIEDSIKWGEMSEEEGLRLAKIFKEEEVPLESLSKEEREIVEGFGNPKKPVYTNNLINDVIGIEEIIYNKLSDYPLIPQLTKDKELDKLRIAMERLQRYNDKPVRFIFESGAKTGAPSKANMMNFWGEDEQILLPTEKEWDNLVKKGKEGEKLEELFGKSSKTLPNSGLRKQQEVPYDRAKKHVNKGSQESKMFLTDMMKVTDFKIGSKTYTGRQLYDLYLQRSTELYELNRDEILNRIEYNEEKQTVNIEQLAKILREEADVRGYSINDKKALGLKKVGDTYEFKSPLWAVANSSKFESLLKSLIDNKVRKTKMYGRSFVLGSKAGYKSVKNFEGLTNKDKSSIIYAQGYDPTKGLAEDEIFITFKFFDDAGNKLNINDFIVEVDGVKRLDEAKLNSELLNIFSFRIPTEGPHSMAGLKIAGFLPDVMGDLAIATDNLIAQMGSDFDIDKLYSYMYNTSFIDGKLTRFVYDEGSIRKAWAEYNKSDEATERMLAAIFNQDDGTVDNYEVFVGKYKKKVSQDKLLDIRRAVVTSENPIVKKHIKSPTSYGKLTQLRDQLNSIRRKQDSFILNPDYQRDKYLQAQEAKSGIGVFALNMTMNATLQTIPEDVVLNYTEIDNEGNEVVNKVEFPLAGFKSSVLNRTTILNGGNRYRSEIMAAYTSAHTDAEKEQIHSALNINTITYDAIRALNQLGFDEPAVVYLINQPIIKEYVELVREKSDTIHKQQGNVKDQVQALIIQKYETEELKMSDKMIFSPLSEEQMLSSIQDINTPSYKENQLVALAKFLYVSKIGDALGDVQQIINTDSRGVGKDLLETNNKVNRAIILPNYEQQYGKYSVGFTSISKLLGEYSAEAKEGYTKLGVDEFNFPVYLKPLTIPGVATVTALVPASEIFNAFYPYKDLSVTTVFNELKTAVGDSFLKIDDQRFFWKEMKKFLNSRTSSGLFKSQDLEAERKRLLFDTYEQISIIDGPVERIEIIHKEKSIASRIKELKNRLNKEGKSNRFLNTLGFKINRARPSKILFNAATGENEYEELIYQDFLNLYLDVNTREDFKDMVSYAFLNGGVQQAIEFIRYIPFEYLAATGYHEDLASINFNGNDAFGLIENKQNGWQLSRFVKQAMQHNPSRAYIINDDLKQIVVPTKGKDFNYFFVNPDSKDDFILNAKSRKPNSSSYEILYKPFVAIFDKSKERSYRLFQYTVSEEGRGFYKEIETLGTFGVSEYNAQEEAKSVIAGNKLYSNKEIKVGSELNSRSILKIKSPINADQLAGFLDNVQSVGLAPLAKFYSSILNSKNPTLTLRVKNVELNEEDLTSSYEGLTNTIVLPDALNKRAIEETVLHEVTHALTLHQIHKDSSPEVKQAIARLGRVKNIVIESFDSKERSDLAEMQRIYDKGLNEMPTNQEQAFFENNKALFYPLIEIPTKTIDEFVTGVLTSSTLQKRMNDIKFNENATLMDRFFKLIADLLSSFKILYKGKTYDVNEDSALMQSLRDSLFLVAFNSDEQNVVNIKEESVYEGVVFTEDSGVVQVGNFTSEEDIPITDFSVSYANKQNHTKYKKFVEERRTRIGRIINNINAERNSPNRNEDKINLLQRRIDEIKDEIAAFEKRITLEEILKAGLKDAIQVKQIASQPSITNDELETAYQIIELWKNSKEILFEDDELALDSEGNYSEDVRQFDSLVGEIGGYEKTLDTKMKDLIVKQVSATFNISMEEALKRVQTNFRDVDSLTSMLRDVSNYGNAAVSSMDLLVRKAYDSANLEFIDFNKELNSVMKGIKDKDIEKLLQTNAKGKNTGKLRIRYSEEYTKTRNGLREKAERSKDYKEYINWLRDNTMFFNVNKLFKVDDNDEIILQEDEAHKAELVSQLGERLYGEYLEKQRKQIEKFLMKKEQYENNLRADYEDEAEIATLLSDWNKAHSPFIWGSYLASGGKEGHIGSTGKFIKLQGYSYNQSFPLKTKDGNLTGWWDSQFEQIENDESLYTFYKFVQKTLDRLYDYLPDNKVEDLEYNFIPILNKTLVENFKANGVSLVGLKEEMITAITSLEDSETVYGAIDPITGKPEKNLRVTMVNKEASVKKIYEKNLELYLVRNNLTVQELGPADFEKLQEEAEEEFNDSRSLDIPKVLTAFAAMSMNYKHKSRVEGGVKLVKMFVNKSLESYQTQDGTNKKDAFGNVIMTKGQLKNLKSSIDNYIDVAFYNQKAEDKSLIKTKLLTPDEKELKKAYTTQVDDLQAAFDKGAITEGELKLRKSLIEGKKKALGSNVSMQNIGRAALKYNQLRGMGWNVFAGITNLVYGWVSNTIHAAGGEDFSSKALRKARWYALFKTKEPNTRQKIYNLMNKFEVLKESSEHVSGKLKADKKKFVGFDNLSPYEIQKGSDYITQSELMLAVMFDTKVTDLQGKERNVYEAYNVDGNWNVEEFGVNTEWEGDLNKYEEGQKRFALKNKMTQLVKKLHANVDPLSPLLIKKSVLGKMLMQFRSWVPEGFANRFERAEYDPLLGRWKKGRYRSFASLKDEEGFDVNNPLGKSIKVTLQNVLNLVSFGVVGKNAGEGLSSVDKANLRKNAMEMLVYLGLISMYTMMKGMEDDDEEKKEAANYIINQCYRIQQDIVFYFSPTAFESIADNALPIFGLVIDFEKLVEKSTMYIVDPDSDRYTTGVYAGESKVQRAAAKFFPFTTQVQRNARALETITHK